MGKPARWLKSVLLGKKPSKSSGSKDKEVAIGLISSSFSNFPFCFYNGYNV